MDPINFTSDELDALMKRNSDMIEKNKSTMEVLKENFIEFMEAINRVNEESLPDNHTEAITTRVRDLMFMKMDELKNICRENNMKGWSLLNKMELAKFIAEST